MALICTYDHLWQVTSSHDIILTSQQSDWDSLLACSSQGCGRLRRGAAPFGCRMLLFFFLTENGTRKRRRRRHTKTIETMSNIVKPRLSWTFHGPFMDLSCLFVDFKAVMEIVIFENTLSDTFRYFQPFSILFFSNPCLVWLPNQLGICAQGPPILHPFPRKPSSPGTSCCGSLKPSWTFYIASAWSYSIIFDPSTKLN